MSKTKSKTTKTKSLKLPAKKINTNKKSDVKKVGVVAEVKAIAQGVMKHNLVENYTGTSPITTSRKSTTRINFSSFNSKANAFVTDRDLSAIKSLKNKYHAEPFARGNLDAGIIRRLGERGYLELVEGNEVSPDTKLRLTPKAFM